MSDTSSTPESAVPDTEVDITETYPEVETTDVEVATLDHLIDNQTPNIGPGYLQTPGVRKFIGDVLTTGALLCSIAGIVDLSIPAIDLAYITIPAASIITGLFGVFQLGVSRPNYPKGS